MQTHENQKEQKPHPLNRYMHDIWYFAVLLSNGEVIAFDSIEFETEEFYVLNLIQDDDLKRFGLVFGKELIGASTSRTRCHVAKRHVVAFQEFAET